MVAGTEQQTLKVVFIGGHERIVPEALSAEFPTIRFAVAPSLEAQRQELPDADAVVGWPAREVLPVARRLRWVHITSAGIERIAALPELRERDDIVLTNSRGAHGPAIADHCFAMMLYFTRDLRGLLADQQAHRWNRAGRAARMRELSGHLLGILGLGRIGSEIARRGAAFGMRIIAIDLNTQATAPGVEAVWGLERLDELLREVDYLAIALPITERTRGLLDARRLALMKPTAYLFVLSRGNIVDEAALAELLRAGRLAGAGLDATGIEPLPPDSPLWDLPNVILSPHCSAAAPQTHERWRHLLRENLRRFAQGQPLLNVCDKRAGF